MRDKIFGRWAFSAGSSRGLGVAALGVIHKGDGVQVVYGPGVVGVKSRLEDFLGTPEADRVMDKAPAQQ